MLYLNNEEYYYYYMTLLSARRAFMTLRIYDITYLGRNE